MKLEDLIVDEKEFDQEQITRVLAPYLHFGKDGSTRFLPNSPKIDNKKRVLLFLVAERGKRILGGKIPQRKEKVTPEIIGKEMGIPGGTLRPVLMRLKRAHVIACTNGSYFIEPYAMPEIEKLLTTKGGED